MDRRILRLAIPNILNNLLVPLLGVADTALMGRLESEIYIGGIALGTILFNFIYWGFGFLRMGTTGLTAQAYGKGDSSESISILVRALLVVAAASVLLIAIQVPIAKLGFSLINGEQEIKDLARTYFYIRIWAAPATLGLYVMNGWFFGLHNARYPLLLALIGNGLNIGFNFLFVLGFKMNVDGVAWGTVIAQYISFFCAIGLFLWKYRDQLSIIKRKSITNLSRLKQFFSVNSYIFLRTILLVWVFAFFTSESASMDSLTLAANQVLRQYLELMAYGVDGFAFAAESIIGGYFGAKNLPMLRTAIRRLIVWGFGIGVIFAVFYLLLGKQVLYLFTNQEELIQRASEYVYWMVPLSLTSAFAYMWDGIYLGATATRAMLFMMIISVLGLFYPLYLATQAIGWGNHGLWLSMLVFMVARGASLWLVSGKFIYSKLS